MPNDLPDYTQMVTRNALALTNSPYAFVTGTNTQNFTLTADCHSVLILIQAVANVSNLKLVGQTTGVDYAFAAGQATSVTGAFWIPVSSVLDSVVQLQITATGGGTAYLAGIGDSQASVAVGAPSPFPVTIQGSSVRILTNTDISASAVPTWLASNRGMAVIDTGSLAANATFVILPATTGRTYNLHGIFLTPLATTCNWHLQDTSGADLGSYTLGQTGTPTNATTPPLPDVNLHGTPLPINLGLQIKNTSSGAVRWLGHAVYSY
jgi:hypothetical protein